MERTLRSAPLQGYGQRLLTVRVTVVECCREPLVPVMVSVYDCGVVVEPVATVSVEVGRASCRERVCLVV